MNSLVQKSLAKYLVLGKQYHSPLPPELQEWYCYTCDGGHSICCVLESHAQEQPREDFLVPVPVKSVLRGYRVDRGWIVVDLPYNSDVGLITPGEDDEY